MPISANEAVAACDALYGIMQDIEQMDPDLVQALRESMRACIQIAGLKATCRVVARNCTGVEACAKLLAWGREE